MRAIVVAIFAFANVVPPAFAQCTAPQMALNANQMNSRIVGNKSCYPATGTATDQETLTSGKILNPVDGQIGTYLVTGTNNATIAYTYNDGKTYTFYVTGSGSPFTFFGPLESNPTGTCPLYNGSGLVRLISPSSSC